MDKASVPRTGAGATEITDALREVTPEEVIEGLLEGKRRLHSLAFFALLALRREGLTADELHKVVGTFVVARGDLYPALNAFLFTLASEHTEGGNYTNWPLVEDVMICSASARYSLVSRYWMERPPPLWWVKPEYRELAEGVARSRELHGYGRGVVGVS